MFMFDLKAFNMLKDINMYQNPIVHYVQKCYRKSRSDIVIYIYLSTL